jgi:hypothetical protein
MPSGSLNCARAGWGLKDQRLGRPIALANLRMLGARRDRRNGSEKQSGAVG